MDGRVDGRLDGRLDEAITATRAHGHGDHHEHRGLAVVVCVASVSRACLWARALPRRA